MTKKQYTVVSFAHGFWAQDLQHTLNSYAREGWRLHSIQAHPKGDRLIFERDETPR